MRPPSRFPRHGGFIFMRAGCLGLLIAIALLIGGGQMLYTAARNRQPVTVTVPPASQTVVSTNGSIPGLGG